MNKIETNKIVWAKTPGFQPWPGIVTTPPDNAPSKPAKKSSRKGVSWVYFLGSYNYAWVDNDNIEGLSLKNLDKVKLDKKSRNTANWKKAFKEAQDLLGRRKSDRLQKFDFKPFTPPKAKKDQNKHIPLEEGINGPSEIKDLKKLLADAKKIQTSKFKGPTRSKSPGKPNVKKSRKLDSPLDPQSVQNSIDSNLMPPPNKIRKHTQKYAEVAKKQPLDRVYGFMRLNFRVCGMIRNLLSAGHKIHFWSQDSDDLMLYQIIEEFAEQTPGNLKFIGDFMEFIALTDIFLTFADSVQKAQEVHGILKLDSSENLLGGKSYIEMTTMDYPYSMEFAKLFEKKDVRYLEVQLQGNSTDFVTGELVTLACGNRALFNDAKSVFKASGKESFFLGTKIGKACQVNSIFQSLRGTFIAGYTEALGMANRCGIGPEVFVAITEQTSLNCTFFANKGNIIVANKYASAVEEDVDSFQKDVKMALELSNRIRLTVPVLAKANEILKQAKFKGYLNEDIACLYKVTI